MPIGGKGLNSGIRGGLWEKKHSDAMGEAVWLFGWLVHRQTTQRDGSGLVLRGKALTYADIGADTGWPESTLRKWMARLQTAGYIKVKHSVYCRMVISILRAKKFNPTQLEFPAVPTLSSRPKQDDLSSPNLDDMPSQFGRVKEGIEIEHKNPGNKTNAAQTAAVGSGPALPDWIPTETWAEFVLMRTKIRRPMTEYAVSLVIRKLAELKAGGQDVRLVLEQSILNDWQSVYPLRKENGKNGTGHDHSDTDRAAENFRRRFGAMAPKVGAHPLN